MGTNVFFLRYGIFFLLLFMSAGTVCVLDYIPIRTKTTVDLLLEDTDCKAYVTKNKYVTLKAGETLEIDCVESGKLSFTILSRKEEASFIVLRLHPLVSPKELNMAFGGNTKLTGYVYTQTIKLRQLIFSKLE